MMGSKRRTFHFDGLGVSGGVVLGAAYVIETWSSGAEAKVRDILPEDVETEIERFHSALDLTVREITEIGRTVRERVDEKQAAIFDAHVELIRDPLLVDRTVQVIRHDRHNAEYVFWNVVRDVSARLKAIGDSYFSERSSDLFDVARRVLKFLGELRVSPQQVPEGCIIVADELGPSDTAQLQRDRIAGFCTNTGGPTSHTAIMAKALSLPAVVGLDYVTHYVRNGDFLILDGTQGRVILNPSDEVIARYRVKVLDYQESRRRLSEIRTLPAVTTDGVVVRLEANIELAEELESVVSEGAEGIGLYRTEYFFIDRSTMPTEEEQEAAYSTVIQAMGDRPVVFRTLDIGGDKLADYIPHAPEANPFLGLRAIRLCLAYPELFRCQLRPLLRAARGRPLHLLLPMVSCVEEIRKARREIDQVYSELPPCDRPLHIKLGSMIEIPSAALQAESFAREVDFFSIGTNDLIQYTLAVDRVNKLVGHLYQELHPAVLQLIAHVARVCHRTETPLTVCGEMAGNPQLALLLVGLGVRSLSMSPSMIGPVKKAIRAAEAAQMKELADRLLCLSTPSEIRQALAEGMSETDNATLAEASDPIA